MGTKWYGGKTGEILMPVNVQSARFTEVYEYPLVNSTHGYYTTGADIDTSYAFSLTDITPIVNEVQYSSSDIFPVTPTRFKFYTPPSNGYMEVKYVPSNVSYYFGANDLDGLGVIQNIPFKTTHISRILQAIDNMLKELKVDTSRWTNGVTTAFDNTVTDDWKVCSCLYDEIQRAMNRIIIILKDDYYVPINNVTYVSEVLSAEIIESIRTDINTLEAVMGIAGI